MSKLLANQIANYNDNGPVEVKEGVNVPSGKPFQVGGAAGTAGQYLKTTGSTIAWTDFPTIPAAQVSSDWNATAGIAKILNKPTLATVATSGSYADLSNKPTIPAAQVSSDWNATSGIERILNKPNLFSGSYTDLSNKPTIPSNLADLADVASTAPNNNEVLKWNGSNWAPATDASGGGGVTTFTALTDTPGNFTSQGSKWLRVNAGATALEFIAAPTNTTYSQSAVADSANVKLRLTDSQTVNDDILITAGNNISISSVTAAGFTIASTAAGSNTTYTQAAVADSANVKLRLTGSDSTDDDILLTAGTNITFGSVTAAGFTINHSGSAAASVATQDTAPGSPSDGDLWFKTDEGRLKVYYQDANSSQWIDTNPPLAPTTLTAGTAGISVLVDSNRTTVNGPLRASGGVDADFDPATSAAYDLGQSSAKWKDLYLSGGWTTGSTSALGGHIIPDTNAAYDLGNAEYKIRHLFLSDNTVYFQGDFLKVAQHNSGGSAQSASYLIPLAKLKDALNASADYEAFKTAILGITDA